MWLVIWYTGSYACIYMYFWWYCKMSAIRRSLTLNIIYCSNQSNGSTYQKLIKRLNDNFTEFRPFSTPVLMGSKLLYIIYSILQYTMVCHGFTHCYQSCSMTYIGRYIAIFYLFKSHELGSKWSMTLLILLLLLNTGFDRLIRCP